MAIGASGQGGILVRVDTLSSTQRLVTTASARPMEMRGREMTGWLRVDARPRWQRSRASSRSG